MKQYLMYIESRGNRSGPMDICELLKLTDFWPQEVDDITQLGVGQRYQVDESFVERVEDKS